MMNYGEVRLSFFSKIIGSLPHIPKFDKEILSSSSDAEVLDLLKG